MVFVNCIHNLSILCKYAGHLYTHGAFYLNPLKKKGGGGLKLHNIPTRQVNLFIKGLFHPLLTYRHLQGETLWLFNCL